MCLVLGNHWFTNNLNLSAMPRGEPHARFYYRMKHMTMSAVEICYCCIGIAHLSDCWLLLSSSYEHFEWHKQSWVQVAVGVIILIAR
jgi:hypothetical protein